MINKQKKGNIDISHMIFDGRTKVGKPIKKTSKILYPLLCLAIAMVFVGAFFV